VVADSAILRGRAPGPLPPRYRAATGRLPERYRRRDEPVTGGVPCGTLLGMTESLPASPPVFVLTASRSGSTLLRFILDSHPALACPPETGVGAACAQLGSTLGTLENAASGRHGPDDEVAVPPGAAAVIRATIEFGFGGYLSRRGKSRWCDKSLDNVRHAGLLAQVFPDAKFICLYRHCMDVIASGVEACPWGLRRFGYDEFVIRHPGNSVAAIADYWLLCAHLGLDFERQYPQRCHRVRYEDLVAEPERTAAEIFSFLEVENVPGITRACFEQEHEADGPSDEKIWFTGAVTGGSVGRGAVVPVGSFPPGMLPVLNQVLTTLSYRPVDEEWNTAVGPLDPRLSPAPAAVTAARPVPAGTAGSPEVAAAAQAIDARIRSRLAAELPVISAYWPRLAGATVGVVVQDPGGAQAELRVCFPAGDVPPPAGTTPADAPPRPAGTSPDLTRIPVVIGAPATWTSLLHGQANLITEISAGRIRCVNQDDPHRLRTDELHAIAWLLGLTQVPLARTAPVGRLAPA